MMTATALRFSGLTESYRIQSTPRLRIDEEQGIIYGVKLCGRFSPNCHGIKGVSRGVEYTREALKGACSSGVYEDKKVYLKHARTGGERGPFESIGKIRNVRYDPKAECPRGDLHYKRTHPDAGQLVEDVKRQMGGFGLSHHVPPDGFTAKILDGRLVVSAIHDVKSVDLVDDPATVKNLWEALSPGRGRLPTGSAFRASIYEADEDTVRVIIPAVTVARPRPRPQTRRRGLAESTIPTGAAFARSIRE